VGKALASAARSPRELDQRLDDSWDRYAEWAGQWVEFRHAAGPDAVAETYLRLLDNQADPTVGHIVSMAPAP